MTRFICSLAVMLVSGVASAATVEIQIVNLSSLPAKVAQLERLRFSLRDQLVGRLNLRDQEIKDTLKMVTGRALGQGHVEIGIDRRPSARAVWKYIEYLTASQERVHLFVPRRKFYYRATGALSSDEVDWGDLSVLLGDELINLGDMEAYVRSSAGLRNWNPSDEFVSRAVDKFLSLDPRPSLGRLWFCARLLSPRSANGQN